MKETKQNDDDDDDDDDTLVDKVDSHGTMAVTMPT